MFWVLVRHKLSSSAYTHFQYKIKKNTTLSENSIFGGRRLTFQQTERHGIGISTGDRGYSKRDNPRETTVAWTQNGSRGTDTWGCCSPTEFLAVPLCKTTAQQVQRRVHVNKCMYIYCMYCPFTVRGAVLSVKSQKPIDDTCNRRVPTISFPSRLAEETRRTRGKVPGEIVREKKKIVPLSKPAAAACTLYTCPAFRTVRVFKTFPDRCRFDNRARSGLF